MKKITIFMCVILMALALNAQEKIMFTHLKNGEVLSTPISQIDSVTFGTGGDTEPGVWINGIYWAKCNVNTPGFFTAKPEDFGMFYQWNRKVGWTSTDPLDGSNGEKTWNSSPYEPDEFWAKAKDPCPTSWRLPNENEIKSLENVGSNGFLNGVPGKYFGTDSQKAFFPSAGFRWSDGELASPDSRGEYWSSTSEADYYAAVSMFFYANGGKPGYRWANKLSGYPVRCVKE